MELSEPGSSREEPWSLRRTSELRMLTSWRPRGELALRVWTDCKLEPAAAPAPGCCGRVKICYQGDYERTGRKTEKGKSVFLSQPSSPLLALQRGQTWQGPRCLESAEAHFEESKLWAKSSISVTSQPYHMLQSVMCLCHQGAQALASV